MAAPAKTNPPSFGDMTVHTMSSLEIESLTGSRHDSVKRTIERLAESGVISLPPTVEVKVQRERRTETVDAYLFIGDKGRRDSIIVVAQLCPEYTARIVDRWQELEAQVAQSAPALPDFTNPATAARAWAEQFELAQAANQQLALAVPKVAFVDSYVDATGLKGFREVAKLLKINEARFREFLRDHGVMYLLGGEWTARSQHIDAGRFEVKAGKSKHSEHAFNRSMFTPKGVEWIAGEWAKYQLNRGAA